MTEEAVKTPRKKSVKKIGESKIIIQNENGTAMDLQPPAAIAGDFQKICTWLKTQAKGTYYFGRRYLNSQGTLAKLEIFEQTTLSGTLS
jgi:hypothetical protein